MFKLLNYNPIGIISSSVILKFSTENLASQWEGQGDTWLK